MSFFYCERQKTHTKLYISVKFQKSVRNHKLGVTNFGVNVLRELQVNQMFRIRSNLTERVFPEVFINTFLAKQILWL